MLLIIFISNYDLVENYSNVNGYDNDYGSGDKNIDNNEM